MRTIHGFPYAQLARLLTLVARRRGAALKGSLTAEEAGTLRESALESRATWR